MASSFVNLYILQSDTAGAVQIAEEIMSIILPAF